MLDDLQTFLLDLQQRLLTIDFLLQVGLFAVILLIALDVIDMTVAALLGLSVLVLTGVFDQNDMMETVRVANGPIALLFGGMVVARRGTPGDVLFDPAATGYRDAFPALVYLYLRAHLYCDCERCSVWFIGKYRPTGLFKGSQ